MVLAFLDGLLRMGYTGEGGRILAARDAGRRHLREVLLPAWHAHDTWGRYFWDWANAVQNCITTPDAARYLMDHRDAFPSWRTDARNMLTLFLGRSSVAPDSSGDMYSGAWAYPEASNCCGRSLWYAPLCMAPAFAQWAALAGSPWARELAVRKLVLATYDVHETGVSEDNIDGGVIVNGDWLNIAHPLPLRFILEAIAWLPGELGASRESHIVRSTSVVDSVVHDAGRIEYSTYDAPPGTIDVLRLAFVPRSVTAGGRPLGRRGDLGAAGYVVEELPNGDAIVSIRHDGAREVAVAGDDPRRAIQDDDFSDVSYEGTWEREDGDGSAAPGGPVRPASDGLARPTSSGGVHATSEAGAAATVSFDGMGVRVIGPVGPDGGLADVDIDGVRQLVPIDAWSPIARDRQTLYSRNGLSPGRHEIRIAARGAGNPRSAGARIALDAVLATPAGEAWGFRPSGPIGEQRLVFGRTAREDLVDSAGRAWRPGTEIVMRLGSMKDPVAEAWWTDPAPRPISGTADPELYRHGVHGRDFRVQLTVGQGPHHARIKLAATRGAQTASPFTISIDGRVAVKDLDVEATAGGPDRAVDLVFEGIEPRHGSIEVRFQGSRRPGPDGAVVGEAFVQAMEVGPGPGGEGAKPVAAEPPPIDGNLLVDPGFEATSAGVQGGKGARSDLADWTCGFLGPLAGYVWQEADYARHPDWGLPEIRGGKGAIRTHGDGEVRTRISQEVEALGETRYAARVWVRAADVRGKGFGRDPRDAASLVVEELDARGAVVRRHPSAEVREAGPYRELPVAFTTGPDAVALRFVLETAIHCRYEEGHVTWDDASLSRAR